MANILASGLRYLGGALGIKGGQVSTDQVDMSGVQLVMDIEGVLASGRGQGMLGGWGIFGLEETQAGAGNVGRIIDPYLNVPAGTFHNGWTTIPEDMDLWVYDAWISLLAGVPNTDALYISHLTYDFNIIGLTAGAASFNAHRILVQGSLAPAGAGYPRGLRTDHGTAPVAYPLLVSRGSFLQAEISSVAGGTYPITTQFGWLMRAIPRGMRP